MNHRWKPNTTVAGIIYREGRYLLVEESTPNGVFFNNPAGHLEFGESLISACQREVLEETCCFFTPTHLLGVYLNPSESPNDPHQTTYLRFAFLGDLGAKDSFRNFEPGILRTVWMTLNEVRNSAQQHRSSLVLKCIEDHAQGKKYPLDLLSD